MISPWIKANQQLWVKHKNTNLRPIRPGQWHRSIDATQYKRTPSTLYIVIGNESEIMTSHCIKQRQSQTHRKKRTAYCSTSEQNVPSNQQIDAHQPSPSWYILTENEGEIMTSHLIEPEK